MNYGNQRLDRSHESTSLFRIFYEIVKVVAKETIVRDGRPGLPQNYIDAGQFQSSRPSILAHIVYLSTFYFHFKRALGPS